MSHEKMGTQNTATCGGDIDAIGSRIMTDLALRFPVCMASDEFHFFPQARARAFDWSCWDDFTRSALEKGSPIAIARPEPGAIGIVSNSASWSPR